MYKVVQVIDGKQPALWCETDSFDFLCGFCQYLLDGGNQEELVNFWIIWTNGDRAKWKRFFEFCDVQELRKRTFQERMQGNERDKKMMAAWAEAIRS